MEIHYTAWLRNRAGKSQETIAPPTGVQTLEELVAWMCKSNEVYAALFSYRSIINASVNGLVVQDWTDQKVDTGDKISFFSPMAGG